MKKCVLTILALSVLVLSSFIFVSAQQEEFDVVINVQGCHRCGGSGCSFTHFRQDSAIGCLCWEASKISSKS